MRPTLLPRLLRTGLLLLALLGAGCDEPPGAVDGPDGGGAIGAPTLPGTAAVCEAEPSTVLIPVARVEGGTAPVDVRVRYHRPDGQYADWGLHVWQVDADGRYVADYAGVAWDRPLARSGVDDYGAVFDIAASGFTHPAAAGFGFIVHPPGQGGDPGVDRIWRFEDGNAFWLRSGDATIYRSNPLAGAPDLRTVRVHYRRYDRDYADWGLHLWPTSGIDVARLPGLAIDQWTNPVPLSAMPNYEAATDGSEVRFDLPVLNPKDDPSRAAVEFIVHGLPSNPAGGVDNKDGWNANVRVAYAALSVADGVGDVWLVQEEPTVFVAPPDLGRASTVDARAVWLDRRHLRWPKVDASGAFRLVHSREGQLVVRRGAPVSGADGAIALQPATDVPAAARERFKWVGAGVELAVDPADDAALAEALRGQVVVVQEDAQGLVQSATTLQVAGQLDDRHADAERIDDLGVRIDRGRTRFALWAPTARNVQLCLYGARGGSAVSPMTRDAATGAWRAALPGNQEGRYYRYVVDVFVRGVGVVRNLVTDPYSISLDADSQRSYVGDLDSPRLAPPGWRRDRTPGTVQAQEDMSIYELHVRDFSRDDATVPAKYRGTYGAFAFLQSDGMKHLRALAKAGLTDVHLLPVFDIASVPETGCNQAPAIPDAAPDSDAQQAAVAATRGEDCFNWGYDPWHYTAPEGSYATDARDGAARIREFRAMVMALHASDLRVGMDVVYNHTTASGQNARSVLDRIVPGYYHRLNATGEVERSTCCDNTATENMMMARLMIDSVKTWAVDHHVDSFRFDLMGHQPRAVMERLYAEVSQAAGRPIQLIGEGWNFGEVANGARFVQASQLSLNGSGIGTFSDRARDHVRGGAPFDSGNDLIRNQGYVNGLFYDDNGSGAGKTRNDLMWSADIVKVGLAGSVRDYELTTHWDVRLKLQDIDYNGQPAGYISDPQEVVNYVENHDNQTLFDNNVYKLPPNTTREDRARVQVLAAAINAFSQGVSYFHAGIDTLRSKSMDRNSYDSGDWFNRIDWTYRTNFFGTGLPPQWENGSNWSVIGPRLAMANEIMPMAADIRWTRDAFRDLLRIRASSRLFRLRTSQEIRERLTFHNTGSTQVPTVLVAHLDGRGYPGANVRDLLYFVNVDTRAQTIAIPAEAAKPYALHPVHRRLDAADRRAAEARIDRTSGTFHVPARTAVVFVVK
ncbi:pullulanase-type alpha-1,6-glucosidase [Tolypothrix campylonemoides VB511288]|nr:pullulanase-type alpha-1,6-glucosidase [Tolypothrix campylonemoides VB511288]